MRLEAFVAAIFVAGCVSVSVEEHAHGDAVLAAIQNTRVRECPADRTRPNARSEGFGATSGVQSADIALTPLASDESRSVRLRRLTVAPGGVIAWHDHTAIQGMAIILAGEMVELRNTCLDPIAYEPGDVALEDAGTAHSWRNEGGQAATILVAHVVAR